MKRKYEAPRVETITAAEFLSELGPARAMAYGDLIGCGDDDSSSS